MVDKIRVLVVDDSALYRGTIIRLLRLEPDIDVVGTARNGQDAVDKAQELKPDVITLDVEMPIMDGLTALSALMEKVPTRVIMLSSLTSRGTRETVRALYLGALDFIAKPSNRNELPVLGHQLVSKIRAVMQARMPMRRRFVELKEKRKVVLREEKAQRLVIIGASTGGPTALEEVLSHLSGTLPAAMLVIQHMPKGFTSSLATRLNRVCALPVVEAQTSNALQTGCIFLAAGGTHLVVQDRHRALSVGGPSRHGVKPAVDMALESAAEHYGSDTTAVILTGMGRDGTDGSRCIRAAGGVVIAQDEATSVIYGMPRSVVQAGLAQHTLPLCEIALFINRSQREAHASGCH